MNKDKAGETYWTEFWKQLPLPESFHFDSGKVNDYPNKLLHGLFQKAIGDRKGSGIKFLEIGCGNSVLLTYFSRIYGFSIYGLDYSEYGCAATKRILERDDVQGEITLGDAFAPPSDMLEKFDIVGSFGVVEHFEDTAGTLQAFSKFLKPGGLLITSIPNMAGMNGFLQKVLNKPVYDIHVPLDRQDLEDAISKAGLELQVSEYFVPISFAVTLEGKEGKPVPYYLAKKVILKTIRYSSKVIWLFENTLGSLPARKLLSGGIFTSATKPK